jgi:predicted enzyme related to lactoylglutathione lyase
MTHTATPIGAFAWIILATSDPSAASNFYRRAFGWREVPTPLTTLLVKNGGPVAGIVEHRSYKSIRKEPLNWLPFVRVASIAETCARFEELGGGVLIASQDAGVGLAAVVRGITGEALGLWQTPATEGASPVAMGPDVCAWFELVTPDPEKAIPFYRAAFGWRIADEGGYTFLSDERGHFGGIVKLQGDWEDYAFLAAIGRARGDKLKVPPHWMIFLAVDDCEIFVDYAESLGAVVNSRAEPLHAVGTFAVLRDPQGVYFSILSKR